MIGGLLKAKNIRCDDILIFLILVTHNIIFLHIHHATKIRIIYNKYQIIQSQFVKNLMINEITFTF